MDNTRLNKISRLIQKELSDYFLFESRNLFGGAMISVTSVRVTPDISEARVYVSIFPTNRQEEVFALVEVNQRMIRHELAQKTRHQLRKIPDLRFFIDDSLDYAENIDKLLNKL